MVIKVVLSICLITVLFYSTKSEAKIIDLENIAINVKDIQMKLMGLWYGLYVNDDNWECAYQVLTPTSSNSADYKIFNNGSQVMNGSIAGEKKLEVSDRNFNELYILGWDVSGYILMSSCMVVGLLPNGQKQVKQLFGIDGRTTTIDISVYNRFEAILKNISTDIYLKPGYNQNCKNRYPQDITTTVGPTETTTVGPTETTTVSPTETTTVGPTETITVAVTTVVNDITSRPQSSVYKQSQSIIGGNSNSFNQNKGVSQVRNSNAFRSGAEKIAEMLFNPQQKAMTDRPVII